MLDEVKGVCYYNTRFVGQAVKTPPSHGGNTGSIPVRTATIINIIAQPEKMLSYGNIFCFTIKGELRYLKKEISSRMGVLEKLLYSIMCGGQDRNIKFSDLQKILDMFGFQCRIKGDHFIYWKDGVDEIINIQPDGNKAKPYQVKQIRNLILKYGLEV